MADASSGRFNCPTCQKKYKWTPQIAGRKVKCKCGQKMRTPAQAGDQARAIGTPPKTDSGGSMYELDVDQEHEHKFNAHNQDMAVKDGKCPSCNGPIKATAVLCINCGFNLKEGKTITTEVESTKRSLFGGSKDKPDSAANENLGGALATMGGTSAVARAVEDKVDQIDEKKVDLYVPLAVIGATILVLILNAFLLANTNDLQQNLNISPLVASGVLLLKTAIGFVIQMPFFVVALLLIVKIFGTSFGRLVPAMLKLSAVAMLVIAGGALFDSFFSLLTGGLLTGGLFGVGGMVRLGVQYLVFWGGCAKLLDMDPMEILVMFAIVIFMPIVAAVFLVGLLMSIFA